jgi:hypothetical protein
MKSNIIFTFCLFICSIVTGLKAQLLIQNFPVQRANGSAYSNAWAGGLNNPQFSEIDLDGDLMKDLLVFDRTGNVFVPFLNAGMPNNSDYLYAAQYKSFFPTDASLFVLLRDYNCDGLEDLFTHARNLNNGQNGITVYRAVRNTNGSISYVLEKSMLIYNERGQSFYSDIYVSNIDLPDINDIDNDGDLDILTFNAGGGYVEYFKNMSIENGWNCDSLVFVKDDNCWGRFFESGISVSLDLSNSIDSCAGWTGWSPLRSENMNPRHAGSTLTSLDMNNDGVKELLLGDISFDNINMVVNAGNLDTAFAISQLNNFPSGTTPINIKSFPSVFYLDVDNDNVKDLIASPNADDISYNDRVAWLYSNSQTTSQPTFNFEQEDFLVNNMIDVGSTAAPVFVDFNGDGLLDLVVGNYGIFQSTSSFRTRLLAFQNIGSANSPVFKLVNQDFASLQQYNLRRLVPSFGDLDNDGDLDIVIGQEDGTLIYVANTGSATSPIFSAPLASYFSIDDGQNVTPQLVDLDRDGDLDLVIGERNGNTNYHENKGTTISPNFSSLPDNQSLGLIDTRIQSVSLEGNSAPFFFDNNGSYLLFMGTESGNVWVYDQIDSNLSNPFRRISSDFDAVDEGKQSILAVADINNDGLPDVCVGNKRGGLAIFSGQMPTSIISTNTAKEIEWKLFPNPAKDLIYLSFNDPIEKKSVLNIYNYLGILIRTFEIEENTNTIQFDLKDLDSGIYTFTLNIGNNLNSKRVIINK